MVINVRTTFIAVAILCDVEIFLVSMIALNMALVMAQLAAEVSETSNRA
jgi:hypothetical protein